MNDPAEWMDDYCQQWQYDESNLNEANLELTMLRNNEGEPLA